MRKKKVERSVHSNFSMILEVNQPHRKKERGAKPQESRRISFRFQHTIDRFSSLRASASMLVILMMSATVDSTTYTFFSSSYASFSYLFFSLPSGLQ